MKIRLSSVMVDDQDKALSFYTDMLGFVKKTDIPIGSARWLTVASPDEQEKVELVLEPTAFPPARRYQKELFDAGIPATAFASDDLQAEYDRMRGLGVVFRSAPAKAGPVTVAVFEDTCGNLIQLYELK
jgi:catechol 2,3-dioxygenase-like lactoylglutathione lyase family enzyme